MKKIYLDNAATTRVDPEVVAAMNPYFDSIFGNPASKYYEAGRGAMKALDTSREQVATLLNAQSTDEIYFTSCATESNNWVIHNALLGSDKKHLVTSAIEHHAILEPLEFLAKTVGAEFTVLPVDETGIVDPAVLKAAIRDDTALVSIMYANNEIGTTQAIKDLARVAHESGVPFHTDACQAAGKIPLDVEELGVDLLSISGHKFHAPKGIGVLYARRGTRLKAFIHGGGQERRRRAGTSNIPGIVGIAKAAQLAQTHMPTEAPRESALVEKLWTALEREIPQIRRNGNSENRIPNLLSICVVGVEGEAVLGYLDSYGIMVSSGSACASGSLDPSHVLIAIGLPPEIAHGSLRFSLSRETTAADIDEVIKIMPPVVEKVRSMSVSWKG